MQTSSAIGTDDGFFARAVSASMRRRLGREASAETWPDAMRYLERFGAFAGRPELAYLSTLTAQARKESQWHQVCDVLG